MSRKIIIYIITTASIAISVSTSFIAKSTERMYIDPTEEGTGNRCRCHSSDNLCYGGNAISFRKLCNYSEDALWNCHKFDSICQ